MMLHDPFIQAGLGCALFGFTLALWLLIGDEVLQWLDGRERRAAVQEWRQHMQGRRTPLGDRLATADAFLAATVGLHKRPRYDQDAA